MKTILVDARNTFVIKNGIYEDMKKLLDGYDTDKIILTNANEEERIKFGIVAMPYEIFSLSHNPNKTDPEYYKIMLKKFSLLPENVVYFEHNQEAVKSAESIWIKTYHYDKESKDIKGLQEFLENNINIVP